MSRATATPSSQIISADEVIDRLLDMLAALPSAAEGLPAEHTTKAYWKKLFASGDQGRRMLEVLCEMPAFNEYAPKRGDAAAWRRLMVRDFEGLPPAVPDVARGIVQQILDAAKPRIEVAVNYWRDAYGAGEVIQRIRPRPSQAYIPNPHRGTTTFQRFQGDDVYPHLSWSDTHGPLSFQENGQIGDNVKYVPRTTLSYCRWPWAWLEPKKEKFNWKPIDLALKTARQRGQTLQVRFQPYTQRVEYDKQPPTSKRHPPERSVNVPDWLWDTGLKWTEKGQYAPHEPDCNDPRYIRHFGDFVRAFAERYDGHPTLESVDVAYAGFWGESGGNTTPASADKLVAVYLEHFKKTTLVRMIGALGGPATPRRIARQRALGIDRPVGWRGDCIGDLRRRHGMGVPAHLVWCHLYDLYPMQVAKYGLQDTWKTAPITLETCGHPESWFVNGYDVDLIVHDACRYHVSVFMPKSVFYPRAIRDKLIDFDNRIGYRFVLRQLLLPIQFKGGSKINLQFFIDNVGCAPIYHPYTLALRFRQDSSARVVRLNEDIRQWLPGYRWFSEDVAAPKGLRKGEVKLDIGLVDQKNQPRVWFAMEGQPVEGWQPIGHMDVV